MKSTATTAESYLASLPEDRRAALTTLRETILAHIDPDFEEGFSYGMIGWHVPHRLYPAGYHADPAMGLPFIALASQKHHLAIYFMGLYTDTAGDGSADRKWFEAAWKKAGKRLDMGKACIRFKRIEDVPLEVLGQAIERIPAKTLIARYEAARPRNSKPRADIAREAAARMETKAAKAAARAQTPARARPPAKAKAPAKARASAKKAAR
jgi:hypothetical protein